MAFADQDTGTPPAVTAETLEQWKKLAHDIAVALNQGGERGMDLLSGLMPEWCEAVDDVNAARQVFMNLADRGLRSEAMRWHADGFVEVADSLSPNRPGWDAWAVALADRGIDTPNEDEDLRAMVHAVFDDLQVQNLSGRSLEELLNQLRRNCIARGDIAERLTLLEAIREVDAGREIWGQMIAPIRRRRAGELGEEVSAAIAAGDFPRLDGLRGQVQSQGWGDELPGWIPLALEAAAAWEKCLQSRRLHASSAAEVVESVGRLLKQDIGSSEWQTAMKAANDAKRRFERIRDQLSEAVGLAGTVPAIADKLTKQGVAEALGHVNAATVEPLRRYDEQSRYAKYLDRFRDLERKIHALAKQAPLHGGSWDETKERCRRWLDHERALRVELEDLTARARIPKPPSSEAALHELDQACDKVTRRVKGVRTGELVVIGSVVGGIGLIVLTMVIVIVWSAMSS